ncbi:MAG: DUF1993 domain-containing protein [Rhodospirillaceae bacterium]
MTISMYQASVPMFLKMLTNLSGILDKAAVYAEAKKIDPAVLLSTRLFPDMFPLVRQVQIAADFAKGTGARLAGVDVPSFPDTEDSFAELQERLAKTHAFLTSLKPEQIDGSEERPITIKGHGMEFNFNGQDYLTTFAIPNFYFHATVAYSILRACGLDIGKKDFAGPF